MKRFARFRRACFFGASMLCACLATGLPSARAQVRPEVGINFSVGAPQGEFSEHLDNPGFGGTVFGGLGFDRLPLVVGAEFSYLIYGFERRTEPFSTTIPDVRVDVETSNNIATGHLLLRLQPPSGAVRPYVDGLLGFNYLFTETTIENRRFDRDYEPIAAATNHDDAALSYGFGGGLSIGLYRGQMGEMTRPGALALNLGFRYLRGANADYLKEGSIRRTDAGIRYEVERSATSMLVPQLGVTYRW